MAVFACPFCAQLLQFEARACQSCGHAVAYRPGPDAFLFLDAKTGRWTGADGAAVAAVPCVNARYGACNWLVEGDGAEKRCRACRHNRIIPDLAIPGVLDRWRRIEDAKHRLVRGLIRLGLPLENRAERADGLAFDFLYDRSAENGWAPSLPTGHQGGLVTLNLIEADDVARERIRREMGAPYRTLLGHFRHEVGHHYWSRLIEWGPMLDEFRTVFGDERQDYQTALFYHHRKGAGPGTASESHVSDYATSHPWEDFAETFAHFLHIVDTLATLGEFGARLHPMPGAAAGEPVVDIDPYRADTAALADRWIPFAFALNAINRSMGQPDLYPFRLTPGVVVKLDFIERMCRMARGEGVADDTGIAAMIATLGHAVEMPAD